MCFRKGGGLFGDEGSGFDGDGELDEFEEGGDVVGAFFGVEEKVGVLGHEDVGGEMEGVFLLGGDDGFGEPVAAAVAEEEEVGGGSRRR